MRAWAPGPRRWMRAVALAGERGTLCIGRTCRRPDATTGRPAGGHVASRPRSISRPVPTAVGAHLQTGAVDAWRGGTIRVLGPGGALRNAPRPRTEEDAADAPPSRRTSHPSSRAARQASTGSSPPTSSLGIADWSASDARTACGGPHAAAGGTIGSLTRRRPHNAAPDRHRSAAHGPPRAVRLAHAFAPFRRSHTVAESFTAPCEGTPSAGSIAPHTRPSRAPRRPDPSVSRPFARTTAPACRRRAAQSSRS